MELKFLFPLHQLKKIILNKIYKEFIYKKNEIYKIFMSIGDYGWVWIL